MHHRGPRELMNPTLAIPMRRHFRLSAFFPGTGIFALGFFSFVLIHFVGDLFVSEILIAGLTPVLLLSSRRRLDTPRLAGLAGLLGLWLLAQIVSDAYNHTALVDRMRGTALISLFAIENAFFCMMV